jgi:hypothetical protein
MEESQKPSIIRKFNRFIQRVLIGSEAGLGNEKLMLKIEPEILMMGPKSNYYKYFFAEENPEKENLYLLHKGILNKRLTYILSGFVTYEVIKRILWNRGYFAYFFFHTRLMSFFTMLILMHMSNKSFEANLIADQIYRYKTKNIRREYILNKISENYMRDYLIKQKTENSD